LTRGAAKRAPIAARRAVSRSGMVVKRFSAAGQGSGHE